MYFSKKALQQIAAQQSERESPSVNLSFPTERPKMFDFQTKLQTGRDNVEDESYRPKLLSTRQEFEGFKSVGRPRNVLPRTSLLSPMMGPKGSAKIDFAFKDPTFPSHAMIQRKLHQNHSARRLNQLSPSLGKKKLSKQSKLSRSQYNLLPLSERKSPSMSRLSSMYESFQEQTPPPLVHLHQTKDRRANVTQVHQSVALPSIREDIGHQESSISIGLN